MAGILNLLSLCSWHCYWFSQGLSVRAGGCVGDELGGPVMAVTKQRGVTFLTASRTCLI